MASATDHASASLHTSFSAHLMTFSSSPNASSSPSLILPLKSSHATQSLLANTHRKNEIFEKPSFMTSVQRVSEAVKDHPSRNAWSPSPWQRSSLWPMGIVFEALSFCFQSMCASSTLINNLHHLFGCVFK